MLRTAKELKHFKFRARDGDIGKASEFCFDDEHWAVRYPVAETGGWLNGRQVPISPYAVKPANEAEPIYSQCCRHAHYMRKNITHETIPPTTLSNKETL